VLPNKILGGKSRSMVESKNITRQRSEKLVESWSSSVKRQCEYSTQLCSALERSHNIERNERDHVFQNGSKKQNLKLANYNH